MTYVRPLCVLASLAFLVPLANAQDLLASSFAVPVYGESTANGAYFPGPSVPRFPVPQLVPMPPTGFPLGDLTMNNATGVIFHTNGFLIATTNHPAYPPLAPVFPPFPGPGLLGPLTGIAIDSAAGILWVTDGVACAGVAPVPGVPIIVPPFPLAPLGIIGAPITGLDWDPITGSLWACSAMGFVYNFLPGPVALAPPLPPMGPPSAVDIVVDRHPGAFPGIYVQFLGVMVNYATGIPTPTAPPVPAGLEDGIAYHNYPDVLPAGCPCAAGTAVGTLGPNSIGNAGFGFTLTGVAPFAACIFAVDPVASLPALAGPGGCSLYLGLSAGLMLFPVTASGAGDATFAISLVVPPALLGFTAFAQWGFPCSASTVGFGLSDSQQFILEAP